MTAATCIKATRRRPFRIKRRFADPMLGLLHERIARSGGPVQVVDLLKDQWCNDLAREARYSTLSMIDKLVSRGHIKQTEPGRLNPKRAVYVDNSCKPIPLREQQVEVLDARVSMSGDFHILINGQWSILNKEQSSQLIQFLLKNAPQKVAA